MSEGLRPKFVTINVNYIAKRLHVQFQQNLMNFKVSEAHTLSGGCGSRRLYLCITFHINN